MCLHSPLGSANFLLFDYFRKIFLSNFIILMRSNCFGTRSYKKKYEENLYMAVMKASPSFFFFLVFYVSLQRLPLCYLSHSRYAYLLVMIFKFMVMTYSIHFRYMGQISFFFLHVNNFLFSFFLPTPLPLHASFLGS